jgi:hypothetical protein
MGETTDEVKHEADLAREQLVQDLNRLEYRVEALSDWHTWFRRYPVVFLGAAFLAALLAGFVLTPRSRQRLF